MFLCFFIANGQTCDCPAPVKQPRWAGSDITKRKKTVCIFPGKYCTLPPINNNNNWRCYCNSSYMPSMLRMSNVALVKRQMSVIKYVWCIRSYALWWRQTSVITMITSSLLIGHWTHTHMYITHRNKSVYKGMNTISRLCAEMTTDNPLYIISVIYIVPHLWALDTHVDMRPYQKNIYIYIYTCLACCMQSTH